MLFIIVPRDSVRETKEYFIPTIRRAAAGLSFTLPEPEIVEVQSDSARHIMEGLEKYVGLRGTHPEGKEVVFSLFNLILT